MSEERLQKILSQAGVAARRAAEKLIVDGHVKVNGKIIRELGTKFDTATSKITVDGKLISNVEDKVYLILNKPKQTLSAVTDDRGRTTVIDLIADINERIYPVGRLDYNTEGLLLLTNDGELMNALLHPRFEINKTYLAKIIGDVTEEKLDKLRVGIRLEDGLTAPAIVNLIDTDKKTSTVEITIHEGRNRQVRRMVSAIGCEVRKLKRIKFANLTLDNLKLGQHRRLRKSEVDGLYKLAGLKR